MNKLYSYQEILETMKICSEIDLDFSINYIIGYPDETEDVFKIN